MAFSFAALGGEAPAKTVRLVCFAGPFETKAVYLGDDPVAIADATAKPPVELVAVWLFPDVRALSMTVPHFCVLAFAVGK